MGNMRKLAETRKMRPNRVGRPLSYTFEKGQIVCTAIENGMSLLKIQHTYGIGVTTVYRWLDQVEEFRNSYIVARQNQAHSFANRILDNVDLMMEREITAEQCRVANDALKWMAAKLKPEAYGDKLQTTNDTTIKVSVQYDSGSKSLENIRDAEFTELD